MLKHEAWPGLDKISTLRQWEREGSLRHLPILVGNNGLFPNINLTDCSRASSSRRWAAGPDPYA